MKKTIAILLVLVLGMVGIFAADTTLTLNTSIYALNAFKVTQLPIGTTDTHDFSKYTALATRTAVDVSRDSGMALSAYLTVANNSTTPYSIGLKAGKLAATGITTEIGYTVSCGAVTSISALASATASTSTTFTEALVVTGDAADGVTIASEEISVEINANDYDSASKGSYVGLIYFNVTAI